MAALPKVVSPLVRIAEREGVELVLVSVEAWPDEVVVWMRALPTKLTARLDADFHLALEAWHREGGGGLPPGQPADQVFDFDVALADSVGTPYRTRSSARGGTGTMFRADWTFAPGPPDAARYLTVRVAGVNGGEQGIDLRPNE